MSDIDGFGRNEILFVGCINNNSSIPAHMHLIILVYEIYFLS